MPDFYVGLMSGTSMDGIDAALVSFGEARLDIVATHTEPYPRTLKDELLTAIREPLHVELDRSGDLDRRVGECFRDAALAVIAAGEINHKDIVAIGSHGQTLRHQPDADKPFSLQIGNAGIIAAGTGISTVANFREADIAAGGQGAPLVPPFHSWLFQSKGVERVVANIGGIGNITILPGDDSDVIGFDTGPGNGLMDAWIRHRRDLPFDNLGRWADSGNVIDSLLEDFLDDPYFKLAPPKSTGFEYFNLGWIERFDTDRFAAADVQATLCALTETSIVRAIRQHAPNTREIFVCGGGVHNSKLMRRLDQADATMSVSTTLSVGLDPDWVEAAVFAWLARRTMQGQSGNLPSATGATHEVVLGDVHAA